MNNKRIIYLDLAKGIGVILVMLGHLQGNTIFSLSPYILPMCTWIFSFHMALFFIISGMLINIKHDYDKDFKVIVKRRFQSIMIPYLWFSLIYIAIVLYNMIFTKVIPLKTFFVQLWYIVGMYGMNVLWFLPALFAGEVIFIFIMKKYKSSKSLIFILLITLFAIVCNCLISLIPDSLPVYERLKELCITLIRPLFASSFIAIGYYCYNGIRFIENNAKKSIFIELCITIVSLVINIILCNINQPVDFRSLVMNNYLFYYLHATFGSLFIIMLCKLISKPFSESGKYKFPILTFYGMNSLIFMAVHNNSAVLTLGLKLSMYVNQYLTRARGYICYGIIALTILIYVTLTIIIINKFFPFILGKKNNRVG